MSEQVRSCRQKINKKTDIKWHRPHGFILYICICIYIYTYTYAYIYGVYTYGVYIQGVYIYILLVSHYVVSNSFETPWTIASQLPLFMGFSQQEYWDGLPRPLCKGSFWPGDQTHVSCVSWSQADSFPLNHQYREAYNTHTHSVCVIDKML